MRCQGLRREMGYCLLLPVDKERGRGNHEDGPSATSLLTSKPSHEHQSLERFTQPHVVSQKRARPSGCPARHEPPEPMDLMRLGAACGQGRGGNVQTRLRGPRVVAENVVDAVEVGLDLEDTPLGVLALIEGGSVLGQFAGRRSFGRPHRGDRRFDLRDRVRLSGNGDRYASCVGWGWGISAPRTAGANRAAAGHRPSRGEACRPASRPPRPHAHHPRATRASSATSARAGSRAGRCLQDVEREGASLMDRETVQHGVSRHRLACDRLERTLHRLPGGEPRRGRPTRSAALQPRH